MSAPPGIVWRQWDPAAFDEAARTGKPILLSISAVWCHWCHVMDETTYADPRVMEAVNDRFVPVRVDNDRRPDINARYNQGGWPTTAFLSADGSLLTGATYMPPNQLLQALERVETFYRDRRGELDERAGHARNAEPPPRIAGELRETMIARIAEEISDAYDPVYGGFGSEPKFPMTDVLDFLLQEFRVTGEQRLYDMVAHSLTGMSNGGMYDHVEGGFFRYSTTRDWSIPHFEKMAEDHAPLLRILANLVRLTRAGEFRETLTSALRYVRSVLYDPRTHRFAGSQDADETYYSLPLEERRAHGTPFIDRTSYSNWTSALAGSFASAGHALDDDDLLQAAQAALDALHETMRDESGLLYHYVETEGTPQVRGLLTDQAAYLRALIDAHEFAGEGRFLDRARTLFEAIQAHFGSPGGGLSDRTGDEPDLGNLGRRDQPLPENCSIAESALRLSTLLDDPSAAAFAEKTLAIFAPAYGRAGLFSAPYGRALRRYFTAPVSIVLEGTVDQTADLREASHRLPAPFLCVRTKSGNGPIAYLCRGTVCAAPVSHAADLRAAFESLA